MKTYVFDIDNTICNTYNSDYENSTPIFYRIGIINSLKEGKEPPQPQNKKGDVIRTNGQDTVLRIPKRNVDDRKFIKSVGSNIIKLQFDAEKMPIKDRDNHIIKKLSEMEKSGHFEK